MSRQDVCFVGLRASKWAVTTDRSCWCNFYCRFTLLGKSITTIIMSNWTFLSTHCLILRIKAVRAWLCFLFSHLLSSSSSPSPPFPSGMNGTSASGIVGTTKIYKIKWNKPLSWAEILFIRMVLKNHITQLRLLLCSSKITRSLQRRHLHWWDYEKRAARCNFMNIVTAFATLSLPAIYVWILSTAAYFARLNPLQSVEPSLSLDRQVHCYIAKHFPTRIT